MGKILYKIPHGAVAGLAFLLPTPALAQSTDNEAPTPQPEQSREGVNPGDIVVTARRTEERLQDVPISITVFNQQQLANRNVVSAVDLATFTPSLNANARFGTENASFSIRGFSQERLTQPSVGTYFADVVVPRGSGGGTSGGDIAPTGAFFDLQNVQVLKGPQGTLFGRNTTGGAVLLVPQKPTSRLEGYVEGSYGNYDMRRLQAVVNVPLADTFRVRAGFDRQKRDGYLNNISGIGPDSFGGIDYMAGRLSIVGDLTPNLENYTIASYSKSNPNAAIPQVTDCFPAVGLAGRIPTGRLACDQIERRAGRGRYTVENLIPNPVLRTETWQVTNTTTWAASDTLTIKNILSYAELRTKQRFDLFGARFLIPPSISNPAGTVTVPTAPFTGLSVPFVPAISPASGYTNAQSTFVEELQFQGRTSDGRLVWQAGAYYEKADPLGLSGSQNPSFLYCDNAEAFQCTDVFAALATRLGPTPIPTIGSLSNAVARTSTQTIGLYAQGSYDLTEQLKVTAGLRYTWDKSRVFVRALTWRFPTPNVPVGFCVNPQLRPTNLPITTPADCDNNLRQSTSAPTWLISLDYKPVEDVLLYAKYARGYRAGGVAAFAASGLETYDAEKVDSYEVGAKTSFRGLVSGTFNVAAFYNNLTNQQLTLGFRSSTPGIANATAITNAGRSRIYGVEAEATLNLFEGFTLSASYAYLNTKLQEQVSPAIPPGSLYDIPATVPDVGGRLPLTQNHKLSVSANYTLPLDESIGEVSIGAVYTYAGEQYQAGLDPARLQELAVFGLGDINVIPSYQLVNFNVNWNGIAGSPIDAQFFMTNALNENYSTTRQIQNTQGFISRYLGEPRTYGVRLRYRFGG